MNRWKQWLRGSLLFGISLLLLGYIWILFQGVSVKEIPSYVKKKIEVAAGIFSENLCRFQNPLYDLIVYGGQREETPTWITILWEAQAPALLYQSNQEESSEFVLDEPDYLYGEDSEDEVQTNSMNVETVEETGEMIQETVGIDETAESVEQEVAAGNDNVAVTNETDVNAVTLIPSTGVLNSKLNIVLENGLFSVQQLFDYDTILSQMCVVNPGCGAGVDMLNPAVILTKDLSIDKTVDGPQILIYHTHSQESFADSVPGEISDTVVGAGNYLTELLMNQYGYQVIHHTGQYDVDENGNLDRDPAYSRALPVLEQILEENPSIQVVIDLHRDGVAENVHLVTEIDGKQIARVMFFNGTCRNEAGEIEGMVNPYREDNLAFSMQMALIMRAKYNGMFRTVYLKQSRYNQHLMGRSALIEVGAQTNTVEEIYNAIPYVAEIINDVLSGT